MSDTPLLELLDVSMEFRGTNGAGPLRVLQGVTLEVRPGEVVCVAGRSGSGKTTLLMMASGLLRPSHGAVSWAGQHLNELKSDELTRLRGGYAGVVFQNSGLIDSLTAAENTALPGMPEGVDMDARERAVRLLADVGLEQRTDHFPWQLSGGEQQRAALARALFREPRLLLVDEPTANLDRHTADAMIDLLLRLRSEERGLIVASHDPALIERADDVVRLE